MPELRKDPIIGRWVIISTERGKRPTNIGRPERRVHPHACPFCPGNETATPPEIIAYRKDGSEPNKPGWTLRVVSNKYPALIIEGSLTREPQGIYDRMNGIGAHEVIIETPLHEMDLADLPAVQIRDVLWAYRERYLDLQRDHRFKYIMMFKNQGEPAGASVEHSHSQLIATPIIPKRVAEELTGAKKYYDYKERCIFCDIIRQELTDQDRIVAETDSFMAFEPYASRFPFETWLLPKAHMSSYIETEIDMHTELAVILKEVLLRLKQGLADPSYNYILHTSPVGDEYREYFHWHMEIIPKLTRVAGFEWGTGFYINPTRPEDAARFLRELTIPKETISVW
ncbi:MAG: galactose-1-phosphate uridylyltransferase [candidate division Zixibacteria bacterium]|nr:galactose-1-phosphate uridylyltransferase [candidate division Zixibacteria bacterium]